MAGDNRSEAPTPRRREEARNKGQVARSPEISSVAVLFAGLMSLSFAGPTLLARYRALATEAFQQVANREPRPEALLTLTGTMLTACGVALAPMVAAVAIAGITVTLIQVGPMVSLQPITPDLSRISPLSGLQRIFSGRSLVELGKAVVKVGVMSFVAYEVIKERISTIVALQSASAEGSVGAIAGLIIEVAVKCGLALLVIAAIDYAYQRRSHEGSLKMSREDLKDELRHSEGDPQLKAKLRQMAKQLAGRRMMQMVPHADVVLANPTHLAVAIEYKPSKMMAPRVTAKGQNLVAEQIKRVAREHGVPVIENPPLARALYRSAEIGDAIPPAFYQAVAEVLAFIYRLKHGQTADMFAQET